MSEIDSFRIFCQRALSTPGGLSAQCKNSSDARALRKRFYRLRAQLPEDERELAQNLQATVIGRHFTVERVRAPLDWTQLPSGIEA